MPRPDVADLAIVLGAAIVVVGVAMVSRPIAVILAGILIAFLGAFGYGPPRQ